MNKEYWNKRAEEHMDDKDKMVWASVKIHEHLEWFKELIVENYKHCSVLDVGCGWGRTSGLFDGEYLGIDFSENLIELARKECPGKHFEVADAYAYTPTKKYEVVLAFHLSGLPEREKEIVDKYLPFTEVALVLVYGDRLTIINPNL